MQYKIDNDTKSSITKFVDVALRAGGLQALGDARRIMDMLAKPIKPARPAKKKKPARRTRKS